MCRPATNASDWFGHDALERRAPEHDGRRMGVEEPEPRRVVRVLEHRRRREAEHALHVVERLRHRVRVLLQVDAVARVVAERLERLRARPDDGRLDRREDARDERVGVARAPCGRPSPPRRAPPAPAPRCRRGGACRTAPRPARRGSALPAPDRGTTRGRACAPRCRACGAACSSRRGTGCARGSAPAP